MLVIQPGAITGMVGMGVCTKVTNIPIGFSVKIYSAICTLRWRVSNNMLCARMHISTYNKVFDYQVI